MFRLYFDIKCHILYYCPLFQSTECIAMRYISIILRLAPFIKNTVNDHEAIYWWIQWNTLFFNPPSYNCVEVYMNCSGYVVVVTLNISPDWKPASRNFISFRIFSPLQGSSWWLSYSMFRANKLYFFLWIWCNEIYGILHFLGE